MELVRQIRTILRGLRSQPLISLLSFLILGLTITFSLAVFSILDAALLRPFPLLDTERWVYLWEQQRRDGETQRVGASLPNYADWKSGAQTVKEMVAWIPYSFTLSRTGSPAIRIPASVTTVNIFDAIGAAPAKGRWLNIEDSRHAERNVVLSYDIWRSRFGADAEIVGQQIDLNLVPHTIVGIAPPAFAFPPEMQTDVWIAMPGSWLTGDRDRASRGYRIAGLLGDNATVSQADSELNRIAAHLAATYPENEGFGVEVIPMRDAVAGDLRTPILLLAGALLLVLILGCANVAHLRLAALEARRVELATRLALGASRQRLGRMLLAESLFLGVVATAFGVCFAIPAARLLLSLAPTNQLPWLEVQLDLRAMLVAAVAAALVTLITSLAPLALISTTRLFDAFRSHGPNSGGSPAWRRVFVVAQIALALLPLAGATLLVRSYSRLQEKDLGFDAMNRATFSYAAPRARYEDYSAQQQLADRMLASLADLPGVRAAGLTSGSAFGPGLIWYQAVTRQNPSTVANVATLPMARFAVVTPGFLPAMGVELVEGAWFSELDAKSGRRIAVLNETAAARFFPGENPLGKHLWAGHAQALPGSEPRTVVAVVKDLYVNNLVDDPDPHIWVPIHQEQESAGVWRGLTAVVHTSGDPELSAGAIREAFEKVDADLALMNFRSLDGLVSDSLWRSRLLSFVFAGFAAAGVALAALGVFALSAFLAQRRAREFGIRIALGAQANDIARLVLLDDLATLAVGFSVGLFAAYGCGQALRSVLFEVAPEDPWLLAGASALLMAAIGTARLAASLRATAVNPARLLRES